jgi:hypothetical protein
MRDYFEWYKEGACTKLNPRMFSDPSSKYEANKAKRVCKFECPVQKDCLMHALVYNEVAIWGGHDEVERKKMMAFRPRLLQIQVEMGIFHPELMRTPLSDEAA